ncbi:MAG: ADP-ribosylation factor-like protein [Promethearchaeota archaeon]
MSSSLSTLGDYYRIIFLGSEKVGKTSIVHWILDLPHQEDYLPTIGVRFYNLDSFLNNKQYFLQLCDISGNKIYSNLLPLLIKTVAVAILVFDYKNQDSMVEAQTLFKKVREYLSPDQIVVVGNKSENKKKIIPKILDSWTKKNNVKIISVSVHKNIGKYVLLQNINRIILGFSGDQVKEIDKS